jgi:hypothetical protein
MARRILNRRELRKKNEQAENNKTAEAAPVVIPEKPKKGPKAKAPGAPKVKKPRKKKEPPRLCARWAVFDAGMKQVAIFNYNQRAEADRKVAELTAKKSGLFFLKIVKEPMPEPAPVEVPVP